jgi:hypothetical protein
MRQQVGDGRCVCQRLEFTKVCAETMRALKKDKSKVRFFTPSEHGRSAEILKGILRHIETQGFKRCGLGKESFTTLGEPDGRAFGGGSATSSIASSKRACWADLTSWKSRSKYRRFVKVYA